MGLAGVTNARSSYRSPLGNPRIQRRLCGPVYPCAGSFVEKRARHRLLIELVRVEACPFLRSVSKGRWVGRQSVGGPR